MKHTIRLTTAAAALAIAATSFGQVVPNSLANVEGNSDNTYPFFQPNSGGMRYQQVYNADQFGSWSGPLYITAICFRPDGNSGTVFTDTTTDVQINMSTTSNGADALSNTFATNVGADDKVVLNRGSLTLSSSNTGVGPKDFDVLITFDNAFLYDPTAGNLLLDVRNYTTQSSFHFFDAPFTSGDSVSRVLSTAVGNVSGTADTLGLITEFKASPVPEPATMVALGLGAAALIRRRKK